MLEGAFHALDLGGAGAGRPGHVAPGGGHGGDLLDHVPGLGEREREVRRCFLQQIDRASAFAEVDIGG